jgi:hypothetical protein
MSCAGCGCDVKLIDAKGLPLYRKSVFNHSLLHEIVEEAYCGAQCATLVLAKDNNSKRRKKTTDV